MCGYDGKKIAVDQRRKYRLKGRSLISMKNFECAEEKRQKILKTEREGALFME